MRYKIWRRFLLIDGSRSVAPPFFAPGSAKEVPRAVKYFPKATHLAVDWTIFSSIHRLQFYPQGPFSHRVDIAIRVFDSNLDVSRCAFYNS